MTDRPTPISQEWTMPMIVDLDDAKAVEFGALGPLSDATNSITASVTS